MPGCIHSYNQTGRWGRLVFEFRVKISQHFFTIMHYFACRYPWTVYVSADKRKIARIARRHNHYGHRGYEPRQTFSVAGRFNATFGAYVLADVDAGGAWKTTSKGWERIRSV